MSFFLNVPFGDKDSAKKLGAHWNPARKQWYVTDKFNYPKFQKWLPDDTYIIVCDFLYIIEGHRKCHKCGKTTRVIAFGIENFYEFAALNDVGTKFAYNEGVIRIVPHLFPFPDKLLDYVSQKYNYHESYSRTLKASYLANNCEHCDALQGDWFLFEEPDSPFFIFNEEDASALTLHKIPLVNDIALSSAISMNFQPEDELIKNYSDILDLEDLKIS